MRFALPGPPRIARPSLNQAGQRHLLGLLVGLAGGELLLWHLSRPALWLDESATMVATQRSWPDVLLLLRGTDAPLVPYYAVLKLLTGLTTALDPAATAHPEVLLRWPSVLAMALAGWVLTVWLARRAGPVTAVTTAAMLLLTSGVSRYGQEARPYALVVLAAVVSTVAWSRLVDDPRALRVFGYAVSVVLLAAANPLAVSLVVAHLVAAFAVTATRPGTDFAAPVLDTLLGAAAGLLVSLPLAVTMAANGGGAGAFPSLTAGHLWQAFAGLFAVQPQPWMASTVLVLAVPGALRAARPGPVDPRLGDATFVARTALSWALIPPLVLLPAVAARPNLLIGRYLMFVVPGWVILAALGVVTVGETIRTAITRPGPRWARTGAFAGATAAVLVVAGVAAAQMPSLLAVRTASGHGEDIRPVLNLATRGPAAALPIVVSSHLASIELAAYGPARADPSLENRMVGLQAQRDQRVIWPDLEPYQVRKQELRSDSAVVLLIRATSAAACPDAPGLSLITRIAHCLPAPLPRLGFGVAAVGSGRLVDGRGWLFALLTRSVPIWPGTGGPTATRGLTKSA